MIKLIAQFITQGMNPYRIVEEPAYPNATNVAVLGYTVPSCTPFSRATVPELHKARKEEVKSNLANVFEGAVEAILLTTDSWTSRANDSYVWVTRHVMDKKFVHGAKMAESHTAENFRVFIENTLGEWDIPTRCQVPVNVVTYNGSKVESAVARSTW
ncbi:hypothetical protein HPB48_009495 [Haemaphysalis longicornis]|uniref:Uncharacterized protein n=1 Tax=Haemaphysalis longicornis TaxID=44386 RepID=A0A9J6GDH8_HAELO|nr:hypothetical protein HPB48_009495 [Haemaphysalis longicornis]